MESSLGLLQLWLVKESVPFTSTSVFKLAVFCVSWAYILLLCPCDKRRLKKMWQLSPRRWLSGKEVLLLLPRVQKPFPAPTWCLTLSPDPEDLMPSSGRYGHCTHVVRMSGLNTRLLIWFLSPLPSAGARWLLLPVPVTAMSPNHKLWNS